MSNSAVAIPPPHPPSIFRGILAFWGFYFATAVAQVGIPTYMAATGDLVGSAFYLAIRPAGGLLANFTINKLNQFLPGRTLAAVASITWFITTSILLVLVIFGLPFWILVIVTLINAYSHNNVGLSSRITVNLWGEGWMRMAGPIGRVGAAVGALIAAELITGGISLWVMLLMLPFVFTAAALVKTPTPAGTQGTNGQDWSWLGFARNFLLAVAGYGGVLLYIPFTSDTAGPEWVGVASAVYAVAALIAPWLAKRTPSRFHRGLRSWLVLTVLTHAGWFIVLINPIVGVILAQFIAGLTLFLAEGSADVESGRNRSIPSAFAGRTIGVIVIGALGSTLIGAGANVILIVTAFLGVALLILLVVHLVNTWKPSFFSDIYPA